MGVFHREIPILFFQLEEQINLEERKNKLKILNFFSLFLIANNYYVIFTWNPPLRAVYPITETNTGNDTRLDPGTYLDNFGSGSVNPMKNARGRIITTSQYKN